jgi:hypothetical protein
MISDISDASDQLANLLLIASRVGKGLRFSQERVGELVRNEKKNRARPLSYFLGCARLVFPARHGGMGDGANGRISDKC